MFATPVTRLTSVIVGGAAKQKTRAASVISAHTDLIRGSPQFRSSAGVFEARAIVIATAGM